MRRAWALLICILLAGLVAWAGSRTPAPQRMAPRDGFSALAAMADVRALAGTPHPIGSAAHDRARDYLVARLQAIGLAPQVWTREAFERSGGHDEVGIEGGQVQDVLAVLPGRSAAQPALLIDAHYDTVPGSPGAADDTAGVAAELQIAERLMAGPRPARDVIFLFSDGEEAGLLGARAFFADHPLARHVGAMLNMEARGGGGRTYMYETGRGNGAMIGLYARTAVHPSANSLAGYLYDLMVNTTDFTVAKARGVAGMNYAFIGRPFDYHSASSTPDTLDKGSLQQMGDQVLAAARALALAPALPARTPNVVYADLMGGPVIHYPAAVGWGVLALAALLGLAGLLRAIRREGFSAASLAKGAAGPLAAAVLFALIAWAIRAAIGVPQDFAGSRPLLARFSLYEAALGLGWIAAAVLAGRLVTGGSTRFWSAFAGAWGLVLVLALVAQAAAPLTAHSLAWPLLAASVLLALTAWIAPDGWRGWSALGWAVLAAAPLGYLVGLAHMVALGVGADLPFAPVLFVLAAAPLLFPLTGGPGDRSLLAVGVIALAAAVVLTVLLRLGPAYSARHPRPTNVRYVADLDSGRFWRAALEFPPDAWTRQVLGADGGAARRAALGAVAPQALAAPARPVATARPSVVARRTADGAVTVTLRPADPHATLLVRLDATVITAAAVQGRPVVLPHGARTLQVMWTSPAGVTITALAAPPRGLKIAYAEVRPDWPAGARPLPPRPADVMAWGRSDSTVVMGTVAAP